MKNWTGPSVLAAVALAMLGAAPASAQDAKEIADRAWDLYKARSEKVENYWIKQSVMGFETTLYFEKQMVDGEPVFVMSNEYGTGSDNDMSEMYQDFVKYAERAKYEGKAEVDGHETYVLFIDDFTGMLERDDQEDDFMPKKGTIYLDVDKYILRRMEMDGIMEADGKESPVHADMHFEDYREVGGMLHPFRTRMEMSGIMSGMSEEDMEEARRSLADMRKQLNEMPESQRKMIEGMMKGQMDKLEEMVSSGTMQITIEVVELRVNDGCSIGGCETTAKTGSSDVIQIIG